MHPSDQTIFALSSGRPPSAIAVVRVSGPLAGAALRLLAGTVPSPRTATRVLVREAGAGEPIDDAVVIWFPSPASATGEDVAEFHVHGSRAVLSALFGAFSKIENMRAADPGEFTRRAFENGKLDLTEAEGLDDLVHADTDRQRRQALRQLKGLLGDKARAWRAQIIAAAALIEAGIDFADEGDVPEQLIMPALAKIRTLLGEIEDVLDARGKSERLRDGLVVAIAGPPNVGKSTLMNQLARREVAIVSPHAGTTRDIIEVQLDLDGYPVTLIDTAGLRETDDPVEQEGVRRARARATEADLVLWLVEGQYQADPAAAMATVWGAHDEIDFAEGTVWMVRNKIDLDAVRAPLPGHAEFGISASRGDGLSELVAAIVRFAQEYFGTSVSGLITRERQRELLQDTAVSLKRSLEMIAIGEELAAEELRRAALSLGRLLGRVDVEEILDVIFREFCIGK
jgi:tRNA modification GTPase